IYGSHRGGRRRCICQLSCMAGANSGLVISARAAQYSNTNYLVDNVAYQLLWTNSQVSAARNGLLAAGVPSTAIAYVEGTEPQAPLTNAMNVAGYSSWGAHSDLKNEYALGGNPVTGSIAVNWQGQSTWWIIETIESYNGQPGGGHGDLSMR